MSEKYIYIRGDKDRGAEVIKMLIEAGGINQQNCDGRFDDCNYFIEPISDAIRYSIIEHNNPIIKFLLEFYKEVELPVKHDVIFGTDAYNGIGIERTDAAYTMCARDYGVDITIDTNEKINKHFHINATSSVTNTESPECYYTIIKTPKNK